LKELIQIFLEQEKEENPTKEDLQYRTNILQENESAWQAFCQQEIPAPSHKSSIPPQQLAFERLESE
jgi:hypothetical protein